MLLKRKRNFVDDEKKIRFYLKSFKSISLQYIPLQVDLFSCVFHVNVQLIWITSIYTFVCVGTWIHFFLEERKWKYLSILDNVRENENTNITNLWNGSLITHFVTQ